MRSAPASPDLMDLMEKSCFEEDSDDDDEGTLAALASEVATRLHIRSASSNSPGPGGNKEKKLRSQKSRRNLASAGEKVKGMLGMKKSLGVV